MTHELAGLTDPFRFFEGEPAVSTFDGTNGLMVCQPCQKITDLCLRFFTPMANRIGQATIVAVAGQLHHIDQVLRHNFERRQYPRVRRTLYQPFKYESTGTVKHFINC